MNVVQALEIISGEYIKYGVNPDIVVYGKAIANGYPLTAILGKNEIMRSAENSLLAAHFGQIIWEL